MNKNKIAVAGLGIALTFGLTIGAGAAQAATPECNASKQQVVYAQTRVDEASSTRTVLGNQVTSQKAARQTAINAGNVELVGQINVQLGSSTALYNTMDSSLASAQAQLVRSKAAKTAAC